MVKQKSFTLVEALISMTILVVLGIVMAPVFTVKKKPKAVEFEHGSFVCIYVNGSHYQRYNNEPYSNNGGNCEFEPWEKVNVYSITAFGKGADGSSSDFGNPAKAESDQFYTGEKLLINLNEQDSDPDITNTRIYDESGNDFLIAKGEKEQCMGCTDDGYRTSFMSEYVDLNNIKNEGNAMYDDALRDAGSGGTKNHAGNYGAVLILW